MGSASLFKVISDKTSGYSNDAALVRKWTGAELTREQFNSYNAKGGFTLRGAMGSDRKIHNDYFGFGATMEHSSASVANQVLYVLNAHGVVFDIDTPGKNDGLFSKLEKMTRSSIAQDRWPSVAEPYRQSPRLIATVTEQRETYRRPMPPGENVL